MAPVTSRPMVTAFRRMGVNLDLRQVALLSLGVAERVARRPSMGLSPLFDQLAGACRLMRRRAGWHLDPCQRVSAKPSSSHSQGRASARRLAGSFR
jgi:hypothetical protein